MNNLFEFCLFCLLFGLFTGYNIGHQTHCMLLQLIPTILWQRDSSRILLCNRKVYTLLSAAGGVPKPRDRRQNFPVMSSWEEDSLYKKKKGSEATAHGWRIFIFFVLRINSIYIVSLLILCCLSLLGDSVDCIGSNQNNIVFYFYFVF